MLTEYRSHQTTDAGARLNVPLDHAVRSLGVARRRTFSILRILPDDIMHDCPIYSDPIYGLRIIVESDESAERI